MGELLILGITLSLDNLRTAILLGGLRLKWPAAVKTALVFGFWDGMAPLVGILAGGVLAESIGSTADYVGAAALLAYGAYLILKDESRRATSPGSGDFRSGRTRQVRHRGVSDQNPTRAGWVAV